MAWLGTKEVASWSHLFGTDTLGRDLLARTLVGGRMSLTIAFAALIVSVSIGVLYGTYAAYAGGKVENIMMRLVDVIYSLPYMILVILLVAFLGRSILLLFIAIGCVSWLTLARITRGQVLKIKGLEFVQVAQVTGASTWRILTIHLIPNAIGPIIIYATRLVALIVLEEAFLSFIGIGVQEPMASWGILIRNGNEVKEYYWWMLTFPGVFLAITLYCLNYVGDGLRDALDPSLKGAD
jgi:oligopeptide transport system permease protein